MLPEVCEMKVTRATLKRRGKGTEGDPVRCIIQYWTLTGELLAEVDTWEQEKGNRNDTH